MGDGMLVNIVLVIERSEGGRGCNGECCPIIDR